MRPGPRCCGAKRLPHGAFIRQIADLWGRRGLRGTWRGGSHPRDCQERAQECCRSHSDSTACKTLINSAKECGKCGQHADVAEGIRAVGRRDLGRSLRP